MNTEPKEDAPRVVEIASGIWIVNGVRYQLRRNGLYAQRPGHKEEHLSFEDTLSVAEGQRTFFGL